MKYLCLVYLDERALGCCSEDDRAALIREAVAFDDELRRNGHDVVAGALDSIDSAATVRIENDAVVVSDGPFATREEQLGGFLVIDARDLNDAIRIAAKVPPARMGAIEIRSIKECPAGEPLGRSFARATDGGCR